MVAVKEIDGQTYMNRVRFNLARLLEMRGTLELPSLSRSGAYRVLTQGGDMTITRLQRVSDDLGVSLFELLQHPDFGHDSE